MDTFKQFISEGRDAPLYHGTSLKLSIPIIEENRLISDTSHPIHKKNGRLNGNKSDWKRVKGVSLTRSLKFALTWRNPYAVVFELDQRRLTQNYKIVPVNFNSVGYRAYRIYNNTRVLEPTPDVNEYEEFVVGTINNLDRYITKILCRDIKEIYRVTEEHKDSFKTLLDHPLLYDYKTKRFVNK